MSMGQNNPEINSHLYGQLIYNKEGKTQREKTESWAEYLNRHFCKEDILMANRHTKKMLSVTSHQKDAN